jgi:hypothetical protein
MITIADVMEKNRDKGLHFFDKDSMKFFESKIEGKQKEPLIGDKYFITSEQFELDGRKDERKYTLREFNPKTGGINTVGEFNQLKSKYHAIILAECLLRGEDPLKKCWTWATGVGTKQKDDWEGWKG